MISFVDCFGYFNFFEFLHRQTVLVVGPLKDKGTPQSAKTVSGKKRVVDSDDDEEEALKQWLAEVLLWHPILQRRSARSTGMVW